MKARAVLIQGQARAVEAGAEAWKLEAAMADAIRDLEALLDVAVGIHRAVEAYLKEQWQLLRASPRTFPAQEFGEVMLPAFASTLSAFDALESGVKVAEGGDYRVEGAADFRI